MSSSVSPGVRADGLVVSYRAFFRRAAVLRGVGMTAKPGEITAVVGRNGAGKTTLFLSLLGFLRPDAGGCVVDGLSPGAYRRAHGVGYLPETASLPRGWTGRDLLARSVDLAVAPGEREAEFRRAVIRTGLEGASLAKRESKCSMGTRRRIAFGCALVGDPKLLVLDEPFAGLDLPACKAVRQKMRAARDRGATVLFASHRVAEVERLADCVFVLADGVTERLDARDPEGSADWQDLEAELERRI